MSVFPRTDPPAASPPLPYDSEHVRMVITAEGQADVRACTPGGDWVRIQSVRDPEVEARGIVERALQGREVPPLVAVVGPGLGYVVDELTRRRGDVRVVALELLPDLVPLWRRRSDPAALIASGQLVIGVGPRFEMPAASWPASVIGAEPLVIQSPVIAHHWPAAVAGAQRALTQFLFERRANEEARQRLAPLYLDHTLRNLPALLAATDVSALDGLAGGDPLVLCGAGPSLERLLPVLRANRHRAWYVAIDTAVRPLLSAGIVPDLIVSIDPTPLNGRHLLNLPTRVRPWVVAETSLDPHALAAFRGRLFACRINRADPWPWLESVGVAPTKVRAWGSVLTSACDLVARMKPSCVAFAGVDLAYTNGQPYCRGTTFDVDWEEQRTREGLLTLEDVWKRRLEDATVEEPDVHGRPVATASHLIAFRNWTRGVVSETPACAFANVTGAGILHGDAIAQADLDGWLDRSAPLSSSPMQRLEDAAVGSWNERASTVGDAAARAATTEGAPWDGWAERVPSLSRDAVRGVLENAVSRLRVGRGGQDMNSGQSDWVDVPFDASNFTAFPPMQWCVNEAGGVVYSYRLDGKTMTLSFKINHSSTVGPPSRELWMRLPDGYLPARGAANAVWIGTQAVKEMGYATVHPGNEMVVVHRSNEEPFPIEDGYFFLFGQLVLEVQ